LVKVKQEQDMLGESLEAAKLLLLLSRQVARGEYVSSKGKSPYQLLGDWLDVVESHAEDVGLGVEELALADAVEDEDPNSPWRLNIEQIVHKDGLAVYRDQAGQLWTGIATY
jgi:pre-mRNA-splicing factor SYF1